MCGISGFIDFNKKSSELVLEKMTHELQHRGPDDFGLCFERTENANIGLGQRRLSILDLTAKGHQPMIFNEWIIVFNGEIYNFREISKELEGLGYKFNSGSDTEVIIKAFDKWGVKAVD